MKSTDHPCRECGITCVESFDVHWLQCPRCSRISRDFKPPDLQPAGEWDLPDFDGVELAMATFSRSITKHAFEY
jgi:hypothetical protein